jgi:hypothetical protein
MLCGRGGTNSLILYLRTTEKKWPHGTESLDDEVKKKILILLGLEVRMTGPIPGQSTDSSQVSPQPIILGGVVKETEMGRVRSAHDVF